MNRYQHSDEKESAPDLNTIKSLWLVKLWGRIDQKEAAHKVKSRINAYERRKSIRKKITLSLSSAAVAVAAVFITLYIALDAPEEIYPERTIAYPYNDQAVTFIGSDGEEYLLDDNIREISIGGNESTIVKEGGKITIIPSETAPAPDSSSHKIMIKIPRGREYQLVLPDQTKVWLSAESWLVFPDRFDGNTRRVAMSGEAYFEVAPNPDKPFIVDIEDTDIEVLGTVFNVYAYPGDVSIVATLLEGSIKQSFAGQTKSVTLHPSQQSRYLRHNGDVSVHTIDSEDYRAYREGRIVFRDTPLAEILISLGRTFDYEINIEKGWLKYDRYNLTVNKREDIDIPLSKLKQSGGFAYEKDKNVITIR